MQSGISEETDRRKRALAEQPTFQTPGHHDNPPMALMISSTTDWTRCAGPRQPDVRCRCRALLSMANTGSKLLCCFLLR